MKILLLTLLSISLLSACTSFHTEVDNKIMVAKNFDYEIDHIKINFFQQTGRHFGAITISDENHNISFEGINSQGMFVSILAVPHTATRTSILKPIRKSSEMVNEILFHSSNIDEALIVFNKYSIAFGEFLGYPLVHFKVVQQDGRGVIVEFVNNNIVILDENIVTNHYLSNKDIAPTNLTSYQRYNIVKENIHKEKIEKILKKTAQPSTIYNSIYNLSDLTLKININNKTKVFDLKNQLYSKKNAFYYNPETDSFKVMIEKTPINIRGVFGFGTDNSRHVGARILLNSGKNQTYGVEFTTFKTDGGNFTAGGVVLEQRLWGSFNMSIGSLGYFNYGENNENIIGLVSNLGWEPDNHIPFKPFITYRSDTIFQKNKTHLIHSLSVGFKSEF